MFMFSEEITEYSSGRYFERQTHLMSDWCRFSRGETASLSMLFSIPFAQASRKLLCLLQTPRFLQLPQIVWLLPRCRQGDGGPAVFLDETRTTSPSRPLSTPPSRPLASRPLARPLVLSLLALSQP